MSAHTAVRKGAGARKGETFCLCKTSGQSRTIDLAEFNNWFLQGVCENARVCVSNSIPNTEAGVFGQEETGALHQW